MSRVVVLGAGAWGTALALQAHRAGSEVRLIRRRPWPDRRSPHLPGIVIPDAITLTESLREAWDPVPDAVIVAVPMQHLRGALGAIEPRAPLVLVAKGVESNTLRLPLEVLHAVHPAASAVVLGGPNFAHEIAAGLPAASVVAGPDPVLRARLIGLLGGPTFRLYGNDDPLGVQLGGAAKNVIAIAAGAVTGAGLGENARAALITRGLAELGRLVTSLGGRVETVAGLSGLGDLLLTCTGGASRNFRCGLALGRGESLASTVVAAAGVIEGVATAPALVARAAGLELPVCAAVASLLAGTTTLDQAIATLMARPVRDE